MTRKRISIASVGEPEDGRVGSQCLKVGEQLYISGQISYSNGELVGAGDPVEQCRQCFRNIEGFVTEAGGTLDDVVSLNIFLSDIRYRQAAITARSEFFIDPGPSATVVGGVDFAFETLLVEISAIAIIPKNCSGCGGC